MLDTIIEITALHRDGREFPIQLSISPAARSEKHALVVGFARDIESEKRTEQVRAAQAAEDEAVRHAGSLAEAAPQVLEAIGGNLDWAVGLLWQPDAEREALRCAHVWKASAAELPVFEAAVKEAAFRKGEGLPGRVWASGDAVWIDDVLNEPSEPASWPRFAAACTGAVAFPIVAAGEVLGVLEFFSAGVLREEEDLLLRLYEIGRRLGRHMGGPAASGGEDRPTETGPSPEAS